MKLRDGVTVRVLKRLEMAAEDLSTDDDDEYMVDGIAASFSI